MLKISGRVKLVFSMFFKLILAMVLGCVVMLSILFVSYNPSYEVKLNGEKLGYVSNKNSVQKRINDFVQNGDKENVGYVILKDDPTYEFALIKKDIAIDDDSVVAKVIDTCDVYYRVYGINVDDEEKFIVESVKEAQEIIDKINDEQKNYTQKAKVEISEKFVQDYKLLDSVEVAVNDIVDAIEKENSKVIKKTTNYTASSTKTVSKELLLALQQSNAELNFRNPLDSGIVTSRYGIRSMGNHQGVDIAAKTGTPIHVAEDGVVTFVDWYGGYGYLVKVQHASGYETYYGHCSKFACSVGDEVKKGDVIAYVGSTGRSTGPHVHFEVRINGTTYDPFIFLSE